MMLGGNDEPCKASFLDGLDVILGVKILRERKDLARGLIAVILAPLELVEGIGTKVAESGELVLLILILCSVGNNAIFHRSICGKRRHRSHSKRTCRRKEQRGRGERSSSHLPQ